MTLENLNMQMFAEEADLSDRKKMGVMGTKDGRVGI